MGMQNVLHICQCFLQLYPVSSLLNCGLWVTSSESPGKLLYLRLLPGWKFACLEQHKWAICIDVEKQLLIISLRLASYHEECQYLHGSKENAHNCSYDISSSWLLVADYNGSNPYDQCPRSKCHSLKHSCSNSLYQCFPFAERNLLGHTLWKRLDCTAFSDKCKNCLDLRYRLCDMSSRSNIRQFKELSGKLDELKSLRYVRYCSCLTCYVPVQPGLLLQRDKPF